MENIQKYNTTCLGFDISTLKLIGQGHQGRVFMLPENKVLKIYFSESSCRDQLKILQKGQASRFFPIVFNYDTYAIIMSYVDGISLSNHLTRNSLSKTLSIELVNLIEEFKNLQFSRLDIRLHHIFVQNNETIKIIDPRASYRITMSFPLLMLRGLYQHGVLNEFFSHIRYEYPDYYNLWTSKISEITKTR